MMRSLFIALALMFASHAAFAFPVDRDAEPRHSSRLPVVAIQPFGRFEPALAETVAAHIQHLFAVRAVVLPSRALPGSASYPARHRYRGDRLLAFLANAAPPSAYKILGLMACDLSVSKRGAYDWGVMGVAGLDTRAGVISEYRLRRGHASAARVRRRVVQVAIHELGHTLGAPHCASPRCVMNDAEGGIGAVDRSSGRFCDVCQARLSRRLRRSIGKDESNR